MGKTTGEKQRSRRWYVKWPNQPYAFGPIDYGTEVSEQQVRELSRRGHKLRRLPRGWQCWPA
jgi:hypothetical protein